MSGSYAQGDFVRTKLLLAVAVVLSLPAVAQTNSQPTVEVERVSPTPTFRVTVISRSVQAVNYEHRSGSSKLDFAGTSLMPVASGQARVNSKRGSISIDAEFGNLQRPTSFGNEYLTYVLWAISPEGRAVNLGEVLVDNDDRSKLHVTTDLQAFALIVTAEPYYAVRQPSNAVVLENVIRPYTEGTSEAVHAKYELMERGGYIPTGYKFDPVILDAKLPLEFLEARNAVRIARSEGAETYAGESYQHAVQLMSSADAYALARGSDQKELIAKSRETVQTAEDAREIAVKKIDEVRRENERQASADAQANSQARADEATRLKEKAQLDSAAAQADAASSQAALVTSQNASAVAISAAQADADRSRLAAEQAQDSEHKADQEKAAMRAQLIVQLNMILETRDSARGLIVSMSDVLFDTGQYTLKPG